MANTYTDRQIAAILQKIISKARHELDLANENGTVDELLEDYGITLEESVPPVNPRISKILAVGPTAGKLNDYLMSARKLHVPETSIEFMRDYDKLTNINLTKFEYSETYSDIIFGPIPHSMEGIGDTSNIIAKMEAESHKYPRVIRASANNELKLSITSFRKALKSTRYFEICC